MGKSLTFHVAPGIHREVVTSSQQVFIKVAKGTFLSKNVVINSCSGRKRGSIVVSPSFCVFKSEIESLSQEADVLRSFPCAGN